MRGSTEPACVDPKPAGGAGLKGCALGDQAAAKITTKEINELLSRIGAPGVSPRTANKYRSVIAAAFSHAWKPANFNLTFNPAQAADRRRQPAPAALAFAGSALTVSRAISAGVLSSTKSGKVRRVPLADQAAAALERTSRREHFTSTADLVFCNALGRSLDDSALRRRYRRVQRAIGARALRFHDLRHTFGSLLASRGVDVVSIQAAMGHSAITTTSRYLHARPASEQAQAFTRAFEPMMPAVGTPAH